MASDATRDPRAAGRAGAVLFAVAGVVAYASAAMPGSRPAALVVIGTVDLTVAGVAWWTPWRRLGRPGLMGLAVVGLGVIGGSMW